jgi:hypothetical protein
MPTLEQKIKLMLGELMIGQAVLQTQLEETQAKVKQFEAENGAAKTDGMRPE